MRQRALRTVERLCARSPVRLAFFASIACAALWVAAKSAGGMNNFHDAHFLFAYEVSAVRSVLDHNQVPLWDPYSCGGTYLLGTPQSRYATPLFLASLIFGPHRAAPILAFLLLVIGSEGAYRYFRMRVSSRFAATLVAPTLMLNGYFAVGYSFGWLQFFGFAFMPWVLFGVASAMRGKRWGPIVAGLAFGWLLGFGGTYATPFTVLLSVIEVCRHLISKRTLTEPRIAAIRIAGLAFWIPLLSAYRLLPMLEEMSRGPRVMAGTPGHSLPQLFALAFTAPRGDLVGNPGGLVYVGVPVILGVVAFGALRLRATAQVVLVALLVWSAAGHSASPSLFAWMRELPVFSTLRYPERLLILASFFACELAGLGISGGLLRARRPDTRGALATALAVVLALVTAGSLVAQARGFSISASAMQTVPLPDTSHEPFRQARGNRWVMGYYPLMNRGSIACGEAYMLPMAERLSGALAQEEYFARPEDGTVRRVSWTPHRIELEVRALRKARVFINQNHHPGWKANVGTVVSDDGLLAIDIPEGTHQVSLRFLPRSGLLGIAVALAALLAAYALLIGVARSKRARVVVLAAPAVVALIVLVATWDEPLTQVVHRTADGMPLRVDRTPSDARELHANFETPATLEAARLNPIGFDGMLRGEMFWRVTGRVPRTVSFLVHAENLDTGERRFADHDALGGTYLLVDAPRNVLLRDTFAIPNARGGRWRLYVGLWHSRGDGTRIRVRENAALEVDADRVLVGSTQ